MSKINLIFLLSYTKCDMEELGLAFGFEKEARMVSDLPGRQNSVYVDIVFPSFVLKDQNTLIAAHNLPVEPLTGTTPEIELDIFVEEIFQDEFLFHSLQP
jgi:hypothetical protein